MAKLNKVNGKLSKNFPPKANRIARPIDPKKINFLTFFDLKNSTFSLLILIGNK